LVLLVHFQAAMTPAAKKVSMTAASGKSSTTAELETPIIGESDSDSVESHPAWPAISCFPTLLAVAIPLCGLRVRDLIALRPGQIAGTTWNFTDDVPLATGSLQLAWGEFDVLNGNIAFRLTRLA
jgi:hypothetical protein